MALLTQYVSFFVSPFGERSVTDELNAFLRSHRIVNVEKKLIDGERGTGWVFIVEYSVDGANGSPSNGKNTVAAPRIDYREILNDTEFALFDHLRDLRKGLAEKAGIPVYAVFTNEQLAGMVKKPPKTIKDLMSIAGIGEAKVKQYGDSFLRFFQNETHPHETEENKKNETPQ